MDLLDKSRLFSNIFEDSYNHSLNIRPWLKCQSQSLEMQPTPAQAAPGHGHTGW